MPYLSESGRRIKDILGKLGIKRSQIKTITCGGETTAHVMEHGHAVLIAENAGMVAAEGFSVHVTRHQCGHVITAYISSVGSEVNDREATSSACRDCKVAAKASATVETVELVPYACAEGERGESIGSATTVRQYVTTKHSKGNNHIAKPEDTTKTLCGKPVTGEGVEGAGVCGNCARLANRRGMVEATPENTKAIANITATREAWLLKAIEAFRPRFEEIGFPIPARIHVSVGYGSKGRGTENSTILGVCFASFVSVDNVNHIYISPEIDDPARVLDVLMHELCHAADDCRNGHKGPFAEAAKALGLTGKMTSTVASAELAAELKTLAAELGEYPHGQLKPFSFSEPAPAPAPDAPGEPGDEPAPLPPVTGDAAPRRVGSLPKPDRNRHILVKCTAKGCGCGEEDAKGVWQGYQVRTTRKWIERGLPFCPAGNQMEIA